MLDSTELSGKNHASISQLFVRVIVHPVWTDYLNSNTEAYPDSFAAGVNDNLVLLPTLGVLQLQGDGAAEFLQGYVTCDTIKLAPRKALFGAMCDIKGRVIASFYLLEIQGTVSFVMPSSIINAVILHLEKYLVFSRCSLRILSDDVVVLGRMRSAPVKSQPRELRCRTTPDITTLDLDTDSERQILICTPNTAISLWSAADAHIEAGVWRLADLHSGIMLVGEEVTGVHLPKALNMTAENEAVDFNKGCYLGQEIIARVEHRGALKRRLVIFRWNSKSNEHPVKGDAITDSSGKSLGQVVQSVEKATGEGLLAGVIRWADNEAAADKFYADKAALTFVQLGENADYG